MRRGVLSVVAGLALAGSAWAEAPARPASTVVVEQLTAAGRRLSLTVLTCPEDRCDGVVRLDANGASFGMALRIELSPGGARLVLRGCEPGTTEADCGPYGTGSANRLLIPLEPDGYGSRLVTLRRVAANPPGSTLGVDNAILRWESGARFHLSIEVARPPE